MTRWRALAIVVAVLVTGCAALAWSVVWSGRVMRQARAADHDLRVAMGWEQEVSRVNGAYERWYPVASAIPAEPGLWVARQFERVVAVSGVQVVTVQPGAGAQRTERSEVKRRKSRRAASAPPDPAIKAAVAGSPGQVAAFLQELPRWLPALIVSACELVTTTRGLECRVELSAVPPPQEGAG